MVRSSAGASSSPSLLPLAVAYDLMAIMAGAICVAVVSATQGHLVVMVYAFLAALVLAVMTLAAFIVAAMVL